MGQGQQPTLAYLRFPESAQPIGRNSRHDGHICRHRVHPPESGGNRGDATLLHGDGPMKGWLYQEHFDIIDNYTMGINPMNPSGTPDLTSRQLQTILALAEYGSFIAAAAL